MNHANFSQLRRPLSFLSLAVTLGVIMAGIPLPVQSKELTTIQAQLTILPQVPPPSHRKEPAKVLVHLEANEYVGTLANGIQYKFWSFNGTVPGPMIRVR